VGAGFSREATSLAVGRLGVGAPWREQLLGCGQGLAAGADQMGTLPTVARACTARDIRQPRR
jgi:hypothetical protein